MNNEKYNGWTNRATWLVNLWLGDNLQMDADEGVTVDADYIRMCIDDMQEEAAQQAERKSQERPCLVPDAGFFQDVISGALAEVNYHELAAHYLEDEV